VSAVAEALFSLCAQCGTVFSCVDKKDVHLVGQHCPFCLLKVRNIFILLTCGKISKGREQTVIYSQDLCWCTCIFSVDSVLNNVELLIYYIYVLLGILYEVKKECLLCRPCLYICNLIIWCAYVCAHACV
jgi:hypothetical protein